MRQLRSCLSDMRHHEVLAEVIEAVDTLLVYSRNLANHPQETKYHHISAVNIHFRERLGHLTRSVDAMGAIGYVKRGDFFVFEAAEKVKTPEGAAAVTAQVTQLIKLLEAFKTQLKSVFAQLPPRLPVVRELVSVRGVGFASDRGKRQSMEDDEVIVDDLLEMDEAESATWAGLDSVLRSSLPEQLASSASSNSGTNGASGAEHKSGASASISSSSATSSSSNSSSSPALVDASGERFGYFGLYDGHGGRETVDFVVRMLHLNLRHVIAEKRRPKSRVNAASASPILSGMKALSQAANGNAAKEGVAELPKLENDTDASSSSSSSSSSSASASASTMASSVSVVDADIVGAIERAYLRTDGQLRRGGILRSGTTSVSCIVRTRPCGRKTLYVANVGDSRAVLSLSGAPAVRLTVDHKASLPEEASRIKNSGGFVSANFRVNGVLAVSRALGDHVYKEGQVVSAVPHVSVTHISTTNANTDKNGTNDSSANARAVEERRQQLEQQVMADAASDVLLLLACDGLWDVMSDQDAVDFAKQRLVAARMQAAAAAATVAVSQQGSDIASASAIRSSPRPPLLSGAALNAALADVSKALVLEALRRQSSDNVTVMLVLL